MEKYPPNAVAHPEWGRDFLVSQVIEEVQGQNPLPWGWEVQDEEHGPQPNT